jgi:hypothetical protein
MRDACGSMDAEADWKKMMMVMKKGEMERNEKPPTTAHFVLRDQLATYRDEMTVNTQFASASHIKSPQCL